MNNSLSMLSIFFFLPDNCLALVGRYERFTGKLLTCRATINLTLAYPHTRQLGTNSPNETPAVEMKSKE